MSQSCSGKCQTFISLCPNMGRNFVHYILNFIKYYLDIEFISDQYDVRMPVQAMRDSPNTSYSYFQPGLCTIINN